MVPAPLLRAAAVALVVAAALSAAPLDRTTAQPVRNEDEPVRNKKEPVRNKEEPVRNKEEPVRNKEEPVRNKEEPVRNKEEPVRNKEGPLSEDDVNTNFSIDSEARVEARVAANGSFMDSDTAGERLSGWPMLVLEKVQAFLQTGHAWQPRAIAALRVEAIAMREVMYSASGIFVRSTDHIGAEVPKANWKTAPRTTTFPGGENFPAAHLWPGPLGWPAGFTEDIWQLNAVELLYHGLLSVATVESSTFVIPSPTGSKGAVRMAVQLWALRKGRMDQLALRRYGDFGDLLPAATVELCDTMIRRETSDKTDAEHILKVWRTSEGDELTLAALESLRDFISDNSAVEYFQGLRDYLESQESHRYFPSFFGESEEEQGFGARREASEAKVSQAIVALAEPPK